MNKTLWEGIFMATFAGTLPLHPFRQLRDRYYRYALLPIESLAYSPFLLIHIITNHDQIKTAFARLILILSLTSSPDH